MEYVARPLLERDCQLGEGALWDIGGGVLYWVDILAGEVHLFDPGTGIDQVIDVGSHVGTVVRRRSGGLVVAVAEGIRGLDLQTKKVGEVIATVDLNGGKRRFNDGKCDPAGRFWVGTMDYKFAKGAGELYRVDVDHTVHRMLGNLTISNGIVWTGDAKTMYFIDTPTGQIWGFDYDVESGGISNKRVAVTVPNDMGHPDGMTVDSEDNVWVALYGGGAVGRWDPRTGNLLDKVAAPGAKAVTSCALGGKDLDELYITTAAQDVKTQQDREEQPLAGSLFVARVKAAGWRRLSMRGEGRAK